MNNRISYSLSEESGSEKFSVNANTGVVSTAKVLDREDFSTSSGAYILKVIVSSNVYIFGLNLDR